MKTTELRQGNLVYKIRPDGKEIIEVENIYKHFINGLGISAIEPIPLTEEWLLNLGFERKSWFSKGIVIECIYYQLNYFVVYLLPNSFEIELINRSGDQFNLYRNFKKEVHILQNAFLTLEEKELTLKNEGL